YFTHRNASKQKDSDFIQDLLGTIKRVEIIEDNVDRCKVYISILQKLNSKIGNKLIPKMQILKEMVSHGYVNNNLALYSDEAIRLNRCLELMLLKNEVNNNSKDWTQLCDKSNTSDLGCIVKISKVKVDITKLIFIMVNGDIDLTQLEENQSVFNSLEEMSKLLLDFSSCYKQYERALYVWFLKQLCVRKGIHWIEIIFTPSDTGINFPFFTRLKTSNIFCLLRTRTLHNNSFNPFIGVYGNINYMDNIKQIMNKGFVIESSNYSLDISISPQMIAESLSLINFYDRYTSNQVQNLLAYIQKNDSLKLQKQKIFWQIFTHWTTSKNDQFFARDTIDVIVTRLGFHFVSILPFMKQNPFQLLLVDSGSFLLASIEHETVLNEPLKVHYCSNNHALLIDGSDDLLKQVKCQINGCEGTIIKTISKKSTQWKDTIDMKGWFILKRYHSFPKKTEPSTLKPLTFILVRLLYHLLLFLRNESVPQDTEKIQQLLKQSNKDKVSKYLWKKIKREFKRLQMITNLNEELLCVALHLWIKDFHEKFETWYPKGLLNNTLEVVYEFEEKLDKEYSTFFNRKTEFIKLRNKSETESNHYNMRLFELMSEIEETKELNECYKIEHLSQLFLEIRPLSWRNLSSVFNANPSLANNYPLIAQLLNWDQGIWYLQYLPVIANLIKYVHNEYSRQLLPDELYQIKIVDILTQKHQCKTWWGHLILCWNYFTNQKLKYNYQNIPIEQFCVINSDANNSQFNIYQIIRFLEQQQNEFLKKFERFKSSYIQIIEEKKEDPLPPHLDDNGQHIWKYLFDITKYDTLCFNE
ncbi:hypothetical protein RFI_02127, partial [Reticulomyxa filosa]